jgi:hypothetical protein
MTLKFLALQGAQYIYDISRLRVKKMVVMMIIIVIKDAENFLKYKDLTI